MLMVWILKLLKTSVISSACCINVLQMLFGLSLSQSTFAHIHRPKSTSLSLFQCILFCYTHIAKPLKMNIRELYILPEFLELTCHDFTI